MKLALTGVALLVLVFGITTSCSITKKSGEYACTTSADCNSGRECSEGFCVLKGTAIDASTQLPIDAPKHNIDGGTNGCPSACTSCTGSGTLKTCTIDCATSGTCDQKVTCPAGYICDVKCNADGACTRGVACPATGACNVTCSANNACTGGNGGVTCGAGKCDVQCSGQGSCKGVTCGSSCACDVICTGQNSCGFQNVTCTSNACRSGTGGACSSTANPSVCDSCP